MRYLLFYLASFFFVGNIIAQPCYFHRLYPIKNRPPATHLGGSDVLALKSGDFIAIGATSYNGTNVGFYATRINQCGDTTWQRVFDYQLGGEQSRESFLNSEGNIMILGYAYDTTEGARDQFFLELDTLDGSVINYEILDLGFNDVGRDIEQKVTGNYVVGGAFWSTATLFLYEADSSGNILWQKTYEPNRMSFLQSISPTTSGGYVLGGYFVEPLGNHNYSLFLIKTDSIGNQLWSKTYGTNGFGTNTFDEAGGYVITTSDGGYLITATKAPFPIDNNYDLTKPFVIKTDSAGTMQWQKNYTTGFNFAASWDRVIELNGGSNYIFCGYENSPTSFQTPILSLVKTDRFGNIIWKRNYTYFGGDTQDYNSDMTITETGDIVITGYILPFFLPGSYNEMFVLKADSCGYLENSNINAAFTLTLDTLNKTITCTNQSTDYCTPLWFFGDGDSIFQHNTTHTYSNNGVYTVTLIVRAGNSTDTVQQQVIISDRDSCGYYSSPLIEAQFIYSIDSFTISLVNQSSNYCHVIWDFGDGNMSNTPSLAHTYVDTGLYTVALIVFAGGSSDTMYQSVRIAYPLTVTANITSPSCSQTCDGAIELIYDGGIAPITSRWSTGETAQIIDSLCAGTYTVTVDDGRDTLVKLFEINAPSLLSLSAIPQNVSCYGIDDGSITLTVSGGTPPYAFAWNDGQTTQILSNIRAGVYSVTAADKHNCSESESFTLLQPDSFFLSVDSVINDKGTQNGAIEISAGGGVPPYQFEWSNTSALEDINHLASGFYSVTAYDDSGCIASLTDISVQLVNTTVEADEYVVHIYPNPAEETFQVSLPDKYALQDIVLIDINGKEIQKAAGCIIVVNNLPRGPYFLRLRLKTGESLVRKVLIH